MKKLIIDYGWQHSFIHIIHPSIAASNLNDQQQKKTTTTNKICGEGGPKLTRKENNVNSFDSWWLLHTHTHIIFNSLEFNSIKNLQKKKILLDQAYNKDKNKWIFSKMNGMSVCVYVYRDIVGFNWEKTVTFFSIEPYGMHTIIIIV